MWPVARHVTTACRAPLRIELPPQMNWQHTQGGHRLSALQDKKVNFWRPPFASVWTLSASDQSLWQPMASFAAVKSGSKVCACRKLSPKLLDFLLLSCLADDLSRQSGRKTELFRFSDSLRSPSLSFYTCHGKKFKSSIPDREVVSI